MKPQGFLGGSSSAHIAFQRLETICTQKALAAQTANAAKPAAAKAPRANPIQRDTASLE